jgi:hypothetical protein
MFAFIFLLLLQFSHCTWTGVIFVTEAVAVMLEFWSDWDSAVILHVMLPSTHMFQVLTRNWNFMIFIGRKCDFLVYPVHFEVKFFCVGS